MEDRIAVLERDVDAIKSELAVIRHDRTDAVESSARVSRIELDLVTIKSDISQLQRDVSQLQGDVSQLQRDVSQLQREVAKLMEEVVAVRSEMSAMRIEITKLNTEQPHYATKADLKALEANMKGWMLAFALSIMTATFAMIYPLYGPSKPPVIVKPTQALQKIPLTKPALAPVK